MEVVVLAVVNLPDPETSLTLWAAGFGVVTKLTTTVTATQTRQDHNAWYISCASPLAIGDNANIATIS